MSVFGYFNKLEPWTARYTLSHPGGFKSTPVIPIPISRFEVTVKDLESVAGSQGLQFRQGDVLLDQFGFGFGFVEWHK